MIYLTSVELLARRVSQSWGFKAHHVHERFE